MIPSYMIGQTGLCNSTICFPPKEGEQVILVKIGWVPAYVTTHVHLATLTRFRQDRYPYGASQEALAYVLDWRTR